MPRLEQHLPLLATIAFATPLIGLLGTLLGLLVAFQQIAAHSGYATATDIASGVYESLLTSIASLAVAIPAFVAYSYLSARVNTIIHEMERAGIEIWRSSMRCEGRNGRKRETSAFTCSHPVLVVFAPALGLALILIFSFSWGHRSCCSPGWRSMSRARPFLLSRRSGIRASLASRLRRFPPFSLRTRRWMLRACAKLCKLQGRSQTIIIKADKRALYENVSAVMNVALETGFPVVLATAEEHGEGL